MPRDLSDERRPLHAQLMSQFLVDLVIDDTWDECCAGNIREQGESLHFHEVVARRCEAGQKTDTVVLVPMGAAAFKLAENKQFSCLGVASDFAILYFRLSPGALLAQWTQKWSLKCEAFSVPHLKMTLQKSTFFGPNFHGKYL